MKIELIDKLYEVREYFLRQRPEEGSKNREMLDLLDEVIDEAEK